MSRKPSRSSGHRAPTPKRTVQVFEFVGTPSAPTICPRDRCGAQVQVYWTSDQIAPQTWSCAVGHGGVVNAKPVIRVGASQIPKGICQRCGIAPVPEKVRRGGFKGVYCTACITIGRRAFAEEGVR